MRLRLKTETRSWKLDEDFDTIQRLRLLNLWKDDIKAVCSNHPFVGGGKNGGAKSPGTPNGAHPTLPQAILKNPQLFCACDGGSRLWSTPCARWQLAIYQAIPSASRSLQPKLHGTPPSTA
ncbi:hypothetical protein M7I_5027 [Glarea lozoyensis 74030]|uniref:Uncharacterized protein n=1 Tax=Glarea lozoyensis (strain ATCC 74030 / MF5533) TaxID=1104152 RepID=H0EQS2_GLAL7|nr:hypothetical protein M7I_5027 [Glarea lozoyensis 74030]